MTPEEIVNPEHQAAYQRDGVTKVANAIEATWIEPLLEVADRELRNPSTWTTDSNPGAATDRLFTSRHLWPHEPVVEEFAFHSGIAEVVGRVIGTSSMRLYFDQTLVKEPDTAAPTPWHHDIPYWPFLGTQIASAWVALTSATVDESSLEFVAGSHRWDSYFAPESFSDQSSSTTWTTQFEGERVPDINSARDDYKIVGFDVEPGDALVFSAWTLHGSPANRGSRRRVALSTRWLGDDTTWAPHPGSDPLINEEHITLPHGAYPASDLLPLVWQS